MIEIWRWTKVSMLGLGPLVLVSVLFIPACAARALQLYFIDVEGGQATLVVTPTGESLLIDAGWAGWAAGTGAAERDADRIAEAAKEAGVDRIDVLVITHYHSDHTGNLNALADRLPIGMLVDHGAPSPADADAVQPFQDYSASLPEIPRRQAIPGDRLPIAGMDVEVLTSAGRRVVRPIGGSGQANPACVTVVPHDEDPGENAQSVAIALRYGAFRFLDLGDLGWNALARLACPTDLVGRADVYLVPHHANADANVPALFAVVQPRVAIVNNGTTKGAAPETLAAIRATPATDLWQLHRAAAAGTGNADEGRLANLDAQTAHWIRVSANTNGQFTVTNGRTGVSVRY